MLPLDSEQDRAATTFLTPWGHYRYKTCPKGFMAAGSAYTDRMDRLTTGIPRKLSCIDDVCLYNATIQESFYQAGEFLTLFSNNGVVLNPLKFQFTEDEAEFVGFTVMASGFRPTKSFLKSIKNSPTPTSITNVPSWFGAVARVSYNFASSQTMEPLRQVLSSKSAFLWSPPRRWWNRSARLV